MYVQTQTLAEMAPSKDSIDQNMNSVLNRLQRLQILLRLYSVETVETVSSVESVGTEHTVFTEDLKKYELVTQLVTH